jgi:lantibiotic modifying enzyme
VTTPDRATPPRLLALGYQGTLIPDPHAAESDPGAHSHFSLDPWIATANRDLQRRLAAGHPECGGQCFDPDALVSSLRERLLGILAQTFYANAIDESLAQYPVLPALLHAAVAEWAHSIAVFHRRFHRDAPRLAAWLGHAELPGLASVTSAASDPHAGGHKVLRIVLRDGSSIFYKPRPVTGEWLWDRLVCTVNAHSALRLPSAAALQGAGGHYGWVAPLPPHPALRDSDRRGAQAYWHAAGSTICLAAHLRMTDLHMANILATSHGPAPVDAESLGTPQTAAAARTGRGGEFLAFVDSLLDTGLLPVRNAADLPDVSGLFGRAAPVPGILVPCWSAGPGAARRLLLAPAALADHGNSPAAVSPLQVLPLLLGGYREAALALMRCRDGLLSPGSVWRRTLEDVHAPRVILRDTLTYGLLLSESLQPGHLQSPRRRRTILRKALENCISGTMPPAVLRSELRDLLRLHIPRLVALPGSRSLAASSGRSLAPRFLACSPAQAVLRPIGELSPQRLSEVHVPALLLALLSQREQR